MLDVNTIGLTPEGDGTPLVIAIELKADDIIELLLANGADVHVAPVFRGPPLALAAKVGSLSITKLLLRAGADPNRFNPKTGLSPLKGAVISRSIPIMQLLLDHGANVNAKDRNDDDDFAEPPLEAAVRRNLLAEAEFLLETGRASIEIVGKASNQLIHRAARKGSVEMMALLLAHGADVNGRNKLRSPIYHAALSGHLSAVEWLVEKGQIHAPSVRNNCSRV
ncbi:hypothetical protein Poli38472_009493 [Pythium oligandrum]|uniref:Ankyrin n=1 Tax=Pythium oligandrum TaxID=41045 RepID=A0A8K1CFU8_PYTOL|nr:hypothetical protein Poli38472_009493 [Pythium oligandrum]|eukprot:TMW62000.1 hypothetical protein Poli38472_009493 [Pythium oligandrum]